MSRDVTISASDSETDDDADHTGLRLGLTPAGGSTSGREHGVIDRWKTFVYFERLTVWNAS